MREPGYCRTEVWKRWKNGDGRISRKSERGEAPKGKENGRGLPAYKLNPRSLEEPETMEVSTVSQTKKSKKRAGEELPYRLPMSTVLLVY